MDSFELNKILGAVLGTCLVLLSLNITANAIFAPHKPAKPGYDIAVQEAAPAGKPGAPAAPEEPIAKLFASADIGRGEASAKKCVACHTFGKGEPNRVGPNLWGIVGRAKASVAGLQLFGGDEGQGRQLDDRRSQRLSAQSQGDGARHQHELRRHPARHRARRPADVPQLPRRTIRRRCRRRPTRERASRPGLRSVNPAASLR